MRNLELFPITIGNEAAHHDQETNLSQDILIGVPRQSESPYKVR